MTFGIADTDNKNYDDGDDDERVSTRGLQPINGIPGLGTLGGFLSFFLSIFLAQAYGRYFEQYLFTIKPMASIFNLSLLLHSMFPPTTTSGSVSSSVSDGHQHDAKQMKKNGDALRITRYALAAYVIGYCYCSTTYKMENLFEPINTEWNLLNEVELNRVNVINANVGGGAFREVVGWALLLVDEHLKNNKIVFSKITSKICRKKCRI